MSLAKQEFTDAGRSMLGRAQNAELLRVTKIVVGSGVASAPSELWPLTALKAYVMDVVISSKRDLGNGIMLVEGNFRSDQAPHAFDLREVGVMAHIAAEADRLYSVSNVFAETPDHIDPAAPTVQVFKIKMIVDRIPTGNITVSIGPSEAVMGENIGSDTTGPGPYKETTGNVLRFKRIVQGTAMEIHDEPGGDTIYIGTSVLHNNLDLYVPETYPGITDPNVLFPTIQAAHDYLLQFHIPPDKLATIHLWKGLFDGRVTLGHPDSQQIFLVGQPRIDIPVTAINYVSPTQKNVACANAAATGLTNGVPCYLMNVDAGWAGGCVAQNVAAAFVTCSTLKRDTQAVYNLSDTGQFGAARRLTWMPSIIYVANPNPGQPWPATHVNVAAPNGLNVQNVCVIGGFHGLSLGGTRSTVKDVYITGCGVALSIAGYCVVGWPSDVVCTDSDFGFGGGGTLVGHNQNVNLCANACGAGISTGDGSGYGAIPGVPAISGKVYLNHCYQGARNWGATIELGNVYFVNCDVGLEADYGGIFIFGPFSNFRGNNGVDLKAFGTSFITYKQGTGGAPTCNPAAGLSGGNYGSYISVVP
jgi:hypothetical protein